MRITLTFFFFSQKDKSKTVVLLIIQCIILRVLLFYIGLNLRVIVKVVLYIFQERRRGEEEKRRKGEEEREEADYPRTHFKITKQEPIHFGRMGTHLKEMRQHLSRLSLL